MSIVEVEEIVRLLGSDTDTFVAGLQENYAPSCEAEDCLPHIEACAFELSTADLLSTLRRARTSRNGAAQNTLTTIEQVLQQEIMAQAAIRGVLYSLPYPVHRGGTQPDGNALKMSFPTSMRLPKQEIETLTDIERWLRISTHYADEFPLHSSPSFSVNRGIETWANHGIPLNTVDSVEESTNGIPTTMLNSMAGPSNRNELILVQLPYQLKIMSVKAPTYDLRILKRIIEMRKSSYLPSSSGVGSNKTRSQAHGETSDPVSGRLYLSDDDIEDS